DLRGFLRGTATAVRPPQRRERLDAVGREGRLVDAGQLGGRTVGECDGTLEEDLPDRAETVLTDHRDRPLPGLVGDVRGLDELPALDPDAPRSVRVVDVEEVGVDSGDGSDSARLHRDR